ncbi:MAG: 50S ribosomal protein L25/general stress protein Ctc [Pseudomonadales bacterium]|jgi:large subunit ribosomal protein L25|nr:50S ribosomal protein L25/general stress protein Ctc [Pseudomonadales bacterium]
MADKIVLSATPRNDVGKGASRRLRRLEARVPGIIYGGGEDPEAISLSANELGKAEKFEAFFSQVLEIKVGGRDVSAIVKDLQRHPARGEITHIDLQRVRADQVISVHVSIHVLGESACKGVKAGGQIMHNMIEVEISSLPAALPEFLEVDVTNLDVGEAIHLSDLTLPAGVSIPALELGEDHDQPVVSVIAARGPSAEEAEGEGDEAEKKED